MKRALLDTSFILSCVREKVDFFDRLESMGYGIVVPTNVLKELQRLVDSTKSMKLRNEAELALKILKTEKYESLEASGKYVDSAIVNYLKENKDYVLATVDKELKKKIKNQKIVLRAKKKLELI
jgi:rRNA-processing protein FCF1